MNRTAAAAVGESDLVLFVVEALKWTDEDDLALHRIVETGHETVAVVNKVDRVRPRERLLPYMAQLAARHVFRAIVPVSASKGENLDDLRRVIVAALPLGEAMFPLDQLTDRSDSFRIGEIIREAYPDPTAGKGEPWMAVTTGAVEPLPKPVTLAAIKAEPKLKDMPLVKYGRLSVQPVTTGEWKFICRMGGMKP